MRAIPAGSSRVAVRGLRASSCASISRFRPIASDRAPTMATVIHSRSWADGTPFTASSAPTYANGSANSVCSIFTSRAKRAGRTATALLTSAGVPSLRRTGAATRARAPSGSPRSRRGSRPASPEGSRRGWSRSSRRRPATAARAASSRSSPHESPPRSPGPRARCTERRLRRHVARRDSRPAGREHEPRVSRRARESRPQICSRSSGTTRRTTSKPSAASNSSSASPLGSSRSPTETPSEIVSTAAFTSSSSPRAARSRRPSPCRRPWPCRRR